MMMNNDDKETILQSYQKEHVTDASAAIVPQPFISPSQLLYPNHTGDAYSIDRNQTDDNKNDNDSNNHYYDDDDDDLLDQLDASKFAILEKAADQFRENHVNFDAERGYRATELKVCSFQRPHMRAFHASWMCFFTSFFVQFSAAPLLPVIQTSLKLTTADIWWTNLWMMVGGIPMRFLLGPLCDQFGARLIMTLLLFAASIPSALTGWVAVNRTTLAFIRFALGAMDSFVPCQYWITCQFVREVGGTAMALAGGLGATGSALTQVVIGSFIFPLLLSLQMHNMDNMDNTTTTTKAAVQAAEDLAWRWALVVPSILAIVVATYFYFYSDDCPLGNYQDVKKAGLMLERSAVDSFRSGAYNMNAWILFLQYAGSCGVDFTMCNGAAMYFHSRFGQSIAKAGVFAFLYGISAIFARGLGGCLSDKASERFELKGRLWAQLLCMLSQGILNLSFARTAQLQFSLLLMILFSILVQMSMGTCFGIVPYVDGPNTGSIAGIVGAGGNVGAVILAWMFMTADSMAQAMEYMGYFTIVTSLLTPLIVIKGFRGILFGSDDTTAEGGSVLRRIQHSPLLVPAVPGKVQHSPHLVSLQQRNRARLQQQQQQHEQQRSFVKQNR